MHKELSYAPERPVSLNKLPEISVTSKWNQYAPDDTILVSFEGLCLY